ncbi:hypothetical protein RJ640_002271 [Escallonia rubra]|uniref:Carbohydrate kinase PfkB domain-containing protein n=1 Tax=Escallonia rubra TaxID=112253 RepID=A0AA88UUK4_9ASTE|nr:hypothetical protein RJ640_002271 [Escallonia rubra]
MVRKNQAPAAPTRRRGLVVGNYCHDVIIRDDVVVAETLGGASSFISAVLDGLEIPADYVSKVGRDFLYAVNHPPITSSTSPTTRFHAHFSSEPRREDRALKRVSSCDPISPSDLPNARFDFGMAVGVGGEIIPQTLEKMLDVCDVVFVDLQALIRVFDPDGGNVQLVGLKESGFFHLLPRIGFLKASSDEAPFLDVEEARKWCCVVVTNGKEGCRLYWKDGEVDVAPFLADQVDPTGAGDSFLGGFVAGLVHGLAVPDAALLGNFFGSLTVGHIGLPKFDSRLLQRIKDEVQRRKVQCIGLHERCNEDFKFTKSLGHEQFLASLGASKLTFPCPIQEYRWDLPSSPDELEQGIDPQCPSHQKYLLDSVYEEQINSVGTKP